MHSSQGERKRALINHIILQNPEYIIVDNVFDSLDIDFQEEVKKILTDLGKRIPIIQIATRRKDILTFVKEIYQFSDEQLIEVDQNVDNLPGKKFIEALPKPEKINDSLKNPLVKFANVTVSYGERAILKNINWEIKTGDFWQLIGPNGSGKSTILSLITGDNPKAYGQDIELFGMKKGTGESVWDIKNNIGYYTSEVLRGFRRLDSIEKMMLSGFYDSIGLYKYPTERQIFIVHDWLRLLGLYKLKDKDFLSLSIGHQRLVLIARAMVKHPPLLILDEPTNGLDDSDAIIFSELVNKIALESNTAILYVSHRKEPGLNPVSVYELVPQKEGSIGKIIL
ncbi:ATP-binding cassette domain-containing protein [Tamlana sp. 2201CG12-4]|uniref:ATP-binding cassette domain-containing protein n=1 Tax=Tamlana sp. 2201CG12-4 TaxID=3112582 RepID=UPI002DBA8E66|nr:ATP-binding cassette domain-containing protein [Tamlana sp. 2201CG12-4]MEC3907904.1 ATP-binding cassette domain-containing protein [Tamlana sp. 2201CG12-4]